MSQVGAILPAHKWKVGTLSPRKAGLKGTQSIAGEPNINCEYSKTIHNWFATWKKLNWDLRIPLYIKINSRWIKVNSLKNKFLKLK